MKKRVCETCCFFLEAGFARNGWCNHPQRRQSSDVKLVVRRGELPCRNGWAQDLWMARGDGQPVDIVLHDPMPTRPEIPASVEELTFLVNSQRDRTPFPEPLPAPPAVDRVVGETPAIKPAAARPSLLAQDPRSAILKAREQYKARKQAEQRDIEQGRRLTASDDEATRPPKPTPIEYVARLAPVRLSPATTSLREPIRRGDVPPVQLSELPRTFPTMTSFPEDEVRFSSVPDPVSGITLPRLEAKPQPAPKTAGRVDDGLHADELPPVAVEDVPLLHATPEDVELHADEVHHEAWSDGPNHVEETRKPEPPPRRRWLLGRSTPVRTRPERFVEETWDDVAEPIDVSVAELLPSVVAEAVVDEPVERKDRVVVPLYDDLDRFDDFVPGIEVAPDVPRMCRTCRDFRPADSGERGWCTNKWAFSHRRMVDADELPCETSIGCWWLPHDDIWLTTADASAHGQPTPLVDQWLAHTAALAAEATEPRRRQRS